ncbi:hypothetical protein F5Y10DRAFT_262807 [Nemania abortiva]|nr:hypothetical protein F5Y10DRAFT_262807 [Nemania abortiva]
MGNHISKQISNSIHDFAAGAEEVSKQISEGVGAVGQSIGDAFFYDNPNRRDRVEQLRNDINTFISEFGSLKERADEVVAGLQPKVDKLLHDNGYQSADDMDRKMKGKLDPEALKKWEEFKKGLNRDIAIENIIFSVTGILTVATGAISGILVVFGVITAATGGAALEVLGALTLVLGAVVAILALIDAAEERDKLRDAIHQLAFARVDARQGLEQMRSYLAFVEQFDTFVDDELLGQHSEWFNDYSHHGYEKSLELAVRPNIVKMLKELDDLRDGGSWRDEDPDVNAIPAGKEDPVQKALSDIQRKNGRDNTKRIFLVKPAKEAIPLEDRVFDMRIGSPIIQFIHNEQSADEVVKAQEFRLSGIRSRVECDVEEVHTGHKWFIRANVSEPYPDIVNLKDVQFTLENVTRNKTFANCQWLLHGYRPLDTAIA